ncbi:hypothetical protein [Tenacibaculum finnmarkense]|uniref:Uncharacterized protein n=1 Tax=Tenacibaculum finnmarkense genomovar ulcerans TaxID=2781388 RepID=A0A2I2M6V8_9FLAO|nr:hypothetical protein [Tenacibaculum finnmarkense]MBE7696456.1 hypothetical protein [Tenacibaculum finnmarkense genomovar ulcerans]MCG8235078.1 hypothetical protein [Tenacibaculum finnmarkense genomovar ulcerans]MCG8802315.1 hypothetical protein [Tenacibaculum finnmarkense]MCG8807119.1 hypothetical protein [Tenacibaculum finnmarkense]MCG8817360.1 hypothetical protein [Tenacibaculum finnmarkense]
MNSIELVKQELQELFSLIDGIEIRYEFKKSTFTHFVEVKPLDLFSTNNVYIDKEISLEEKFSELFPSEDLVFISEDSLSKIENPLLTLSPIKIVYKQEKQLFYTIDEPLNNFQMDINNELNFASAA